VLETNIQDFYSSFEIYTDPMNTLKKFLFIILLLVSTMAVAGPIELAITKNSIPEPTQMLLLGICLVGLASYSRKKIYKE
jgi:hypothetical protein